jgi:hypothetical protein
VIDELLEAPIEDLVPIPPFALKESSELFGGKYRTMTTPEPPAPP